MKDRTLSLKLDRNFYFLIFITGMLMNFAVSCNGDRMPVLIQDHDFAYQDDTHFTFERLSDVKFGMLTDVISFQANIGPGYLIAFSLGDCLLVLGIIALIVNNIQSWRSYRRGEYK
jgi:hypothetical protein